MITTFYWIFNMTIMGSILGVILLLLRKVKKIPRNFIYGLYSIIYIRLLCPFGISGGVSFLNLLPKGTVRLVNVSMENQVESQLNLSLSNFVQKATTYEPMVLKTDRVTRLYEIGSYLWLLGSIILLLGYCILYYMARKELRKAKLVHHNIYQSSLVNVPMVVGILKPRIVLPAIMEKHDKHLKYLIAHEKTHIRRKDNLWRLITIFITCIHWFNPFSWIILKYFFIDMELACDEKTIHNYSNEERMEYATTLLEFATKDPILYATSFSGGNVKIRMKRVINFRKLTLFTTFLFIIMFFIFLVIFLSNK